MQIEFVENKSSIKVISNTKRQNSYVGCDRIKIPFIKSPAQNPQTANIYSTVCSIHLLHTYFTVDSFSQSNIELWDKKTTQHTHSTCT